MNHSDRLLTCKYAILRIAVNTRENAEPNPDKENAQGEGAYLTEPITAIVRIIIWLCKRRAPERAPRLMPPSMLDAPGLKERFPKGCVPMGFDGLII